MQQLARAQDGQPIPKSRLFLGGVERDESGPEWTVFRGKSLGGWFDLVIRV
jgi:hypothetical protein